MRYLYGFKRFVTRHSEHILPLVLLVILLILTALKISGTSIGVYHTKFYGEESKDPYLIYGHPRLIRSDEFLVNTQMAIIQSENGFSRINPTQGEGKDVSVVLDTPYWEWSTLFKPQNFSFFVMPLEYAFAFKWWLLLFSLIASAYYFFLKLLNGKKIYIAIAGALLIGCSPFVFWWYQAGTTLTLTYGFILLILSINLIQKAKNNLDAPFKLNKEVAIKTALLAYVFVSFILILYPPFQIPVALVIAFLFVGYCLQNITFKKWKQVWRFLIPFLLAFLMGTLICGTFVATRYDTFKAISNTAYPGKREVASGKDEFSKRLLVPYLQPQLQRESKGTQYFLNQSEASMFLISSLIIFIPSAALLAWLYYKRHIFEWTLAALIAVNGLFLAHMFLPLPSIFTKLFLLHLVPQQRLLIGLGFAGTITLIYMAMLIQKYIQIKKDRHIYSFAVVYTLALFAIGTWAGVSIAELYPKFISNLYLILTLNAIFCLGILSFLVTKIRLGLGILALFSLLSVVYVHPLYVGLGDIIHNNSITTTIQKVSSPQSTWGVVDGTYINNFPQIAGRTSISGVEFYPNNNFWAKYVGQKNQDIYNRYAHITLSDTPETITLLQSDLIKVSMRCDKPIIQKIDYILSTKPLFMTCVSPLQEVVYPASRYYIYEIKH